MKTSALLITLLFGSAGFAQTTTYNVEGMHCGSCAKNVKAEVCTMQGLEKCEVTTGKVVVKPKAGVMISQDQIQAAISKAGEYKIISSEKSK